VRPGRRRGEGEDDDKDGGGCVDATKLQYCRGVVLEALRLYPPVTLTLRNLEKAVDVGGDDGALARVTLPAGTRVYMPIWWVHREESNFPDPLTFAPERWVRWSDEAGEWVERFDNDGREGEEEHGKSSAVVREETAGESRADCSTYCARLPPANRDAFVACSSGARSCVGRRFAMQEAVTNLAELVRDVKVEVATPEYKVEPMRKGAVQIPRGGMPLVERRREP